MARMCGGLPTRPRLPGFRPQPFPPCLRGPAMRRILLYLFTGGFFLGMLTGCHTLGLLCHTNGICDCDHDDDPCTHRAPWNRGGNSYPVIQHPAAATVVTPTTE